MRIYDVIKKKRDGFELTTEEIEFFINGYVEGSIHYRDWQGSDGQRHFTTEITASELKLLGRRTEGVQPQPSVHQPAQPQYQPPQYQPPQYPTPQPVAAPSQPAVAAMDDDDLPF